LRHVVSARSRLLILPMLVLILCLAACGPSWQVAVSRADGTELLVDATLLAEFSDFVEPLDGGEAVPVERVLVAAGHSAVDTLHITGEGDGSESSFVWASVADEAWWLTDGSLAVGDERLRAARLEVQPPPLLDAVEASITDIAPTVADALGLPMPSQATGRPLQAPVADRVILIFLDGFGYMRYAEALADGLIPNLSGLGKPLVALTTYPPITAVSTASLLTGSTPDVHGVDQRGIRKTDTETLFDVAVSAGMRILAVEGESLAFGLRGAEPQLSADFDGNGSTDDNVLANALEVLSTDDWDILFVHFHGVDDAGHTYGPGAPEERSAIHTEDDAVGRIVESLPQGTLVIIFADHGMHQVEEEGRLGNHGHLVDRDMFIPIFLVSR
jgi:hypothetical protein